MIIIPYGAEASKSAVNRSENELGIYHSYS